MSWSSNVWVYPPRKWKISMNVYVTWKITMKGYVSQFRNILSFFLKGRNILSWLARQSLSSVNHLRTGQGKKVTVGRWSYWIAVLKDECWLSTQLALGNSAPCCLGAAGVQTDPAHGLVAFETMTLASKSGNPLSNDWWGHHVLSARSHPITMPLPFPWGEEGDWDLYHHSWCSGFRPYPDGTGHDLQMNGCRSHQASINNSEPLSKHSQMWIIQESSIMGLYQGKHIPHMFMHRCTQPVRVFDWIV